MSKVHLQLTLRGFSKMQVALAHQSSGQAKQGSTTADIVTTEKERAQSCDETDVLMVFCTEKQKIKQPRNLPRMIGIAQPAQWPEYVGWYRRTKKGAHASNYVLLPWLAASPIDANFHNAFLQETDMVPGQYLVY